MATRLTYLGALPFLLAVFISLNPYLNLPESLGGKITFADFKAKALMHTYAAVILSFLAGIQWAVSLNDIKHSKLLLVSNFIAIIAWLSLLFFASKIALFLLLLGFIMALIADHYAYKNQLLPEWFWLLRKKISLIACLAILFVIIIT